MKLLTALTTLVLLSNRISAQQVRPQNLCRDALEQGSVFAADPSACDLYLFCAPDGVTHTQSCAIDSPEFPFFNFDRCTSSNTHCTPLTNLCPPAGEMDIMIAVAGDETCQQFRPCRLPGMPPMSCSGENHFDRNTGTCVNPERAPCFFEQNPVLVCTEAEGKFPVPQSCTAYFFCFNWEVVGFFECVDGWHFVTGPGANEGECQEATDFICPYDPTMRAQPETTQRKSPRDFIDFIRGRTSV